jgi:hypothetical protein
VSDSFVDGGLLVSNSQLLVELLSTQLCPVKGLQAGFSTAVLGDVMLITSQICDVCYLSVTWCLLAVGLSQV